MALPSPSVWPKRSCRGEICMEEDREIGVLCRIRRGVELPLAGQPFPHTPVKQASTRGTK